MRAVYPGSFDPLTLGHLDIIKRAAGIFTELVVLVSSNIEKVERLELKSRIALVEEAVADLDNVRVDSFGGLTVNYAREKKFDVLLRGIRGADDFEVELEMSQINSALTQGLETVFLMTSPQYSFIRSSRVWELIKLGSDVSFMVPENVHKFFE